MDGGTIPAVFARRDDGAGFAVIGGKLINLGIRDYRAGDHVAALFMDGGIRIVILDAIHSGRCAWCAVKQPVHAIGLVVGDAEGGAP
jgi:hypothetical protein